MNCFASKASVKNDLSVWPPRRFVRSYQKIRHFTLISVCLSKYRKEPSAPSDGVQKGREGKRIQRHERWHTRIKRRETSKVNGCVSKDSRYMVNDLKQSFCGTSMEESDPTNFSHVVVTLPPREGDNKCRGHQGLDRKGTKFRTGRTSEGFRPVSRGSVTTVKEWSQTSTFEQSGQV